MTTVANIASPPRIEQALRFASKRTGADFDYLLKTALRESSLKSGAKSSTSSAKGLFQFIEQTWLSTMKKAGNEFGLGHLSRSIERRGDGSYHVADTATRSAILALRDDPRTSALMAGAYSRDSAQKLHAALGRSPSAGELYIAHFMGKNGAIEFISLAHKSPKAIAAHHFPQAASSNRQIFYTQQGRPRNVAEVYQNLMSKHGNQRIEFAHKRAPSVEFSADKHLSSHFKSPEAPGFFSALFGARTATKAVAGVTAPEKPGEKQARQGVSILHKQPMQLLTRAITTATQAYEENGARLHVASAPIKAYQKQQAGAKVHNLFAAPGLRGTFR